jgi:hypothetical protein
MKRPAFRIELVCPDAPRACHIYSMGKLRPRSLSLCVGLLALAAACEGSGGSTAATTGGSGGGTPGTGGSGMAMMPGTPEPTGPIPGARACQIQVTEVALYQGVKVPLYAQGRAVTPLNAPIIEGRRAYLRTFVSLGGGAGGGVRATLFLQSASGTRMSTQDFQVDVDSVDGNLATTINWDITGENFQPDSSLRLEIQLGDSCPNGGRLQLPASGALALDPRPTGVLKVVLVPVRYDADQSGRLPDVTDEQLKRYQDILLAYYPTRSVELTVHETVSTSISLAANSGWASFLDALRSLRAQDGVPADLYYYGLVSPANSFQLYCRGTCTAGLSYLADGANLAARQVGAGVGFGGTLAGETLVHEIGHQHGRSHTECGGGAGPDPRFPYEGGSIGVWGFDFRNMRLRSPFGPPESAAHKDFMGYCSPQWISDYTFGALALRRASVSLAASLRDGGAVATGPGTRPIGTGEPRQVLLVGEGEAVQWGHPASGAEAPAGQPVMAQVLDSRGKIIDRVTVYRTDYGHGQGASLELPTPRPGWAALALVNPDGTGRTVRLDRVAAAVPALAPLDPGRPTLRRWLGDGSSAFQPD